ncbi:MAG: hypothetical protein ABSA40_02970 [Candidatus Dormibacteria bacterium]|jgi:hypothetical protein
MDAAGGPEPDMDMVMASMLADVRDIRVFFPVLVSRLAAALPEAVEVEREGGLLKRNHPVRKVTVRADDEVFDAELTPTGLVCRSSHALQGVMTEITFEAWLRLLLVSLRRQAAGSASVSAALRSFIV